MPPINDRRKLDKLLVAVCAICVIACVISVVVSATVVNTSNRTEENTSEVNEVQRLAAENERRIVESQQAADALCALRADLRRRVRTSRAFLKQNPDGIPGIPGKTIRDGIANQRRTIRALRELSC
jgi:hypothetical protein